MTGGATEGGRLCIREEALKQVVSHYVVLDGVKVKRSTGIVVRSREDQKFKRVVSSNNIAMAVVSVKRIKCCRLGLTL